MNKYKIKPSHIIIFTVFAILLAAVIALGAALVFIGGIVEHEKEARTWDTKLIYACYNNRIYPCSEDGVSRWNEQHPDKVITSEYLRNPNF
jgi:hypothetical protein